MKSTLELTELAIAAGIEYRKRMATERAELGPREELSANLEQALTLAEMEMLVDLLDPLYDYETRVSEEHLPQAHRLHEMLTGAIRRWKFHAGAQGLAPPTPAVIPQTSDRPE